MKRFLGDVLKIALGILLAFCIPRCAIVPESKFHNEPFNPMRNINVLTDLLCDEDVEWIVNVAMTELMEDGYMDVLVDKVMDRVEERSMCNGDLAET